MSEPRENISQKFVNFKVLFEFSSRFNYLKLLPRLDFTNGL